MDDFIIGIIIFFIVIIAIYFGAFSNEPYTNKYAQKYATPVKCFLEHIKRMECAKNINEVITTFDLVKEEYEELKRRCQLNKVATSQICSIAHNRYIQIHGEDLDTYQQDALMFKLDLEDFFSTTLIKALKDYCRKMDEQIDSLKTEKAKEKRRDNKTAAISQCIIANNLKGNKERLAEIAMCGIELEFKIGDKTNV